MRVMIVIVSSLLVFSAFNYGIYQKETIKAKGETVFLELVPADPRSLMQGDYMRLRYAVERGQRVPARDKRGYIVIVTDPNNVGVFKRFYQGEPLASGEKLLRYHSQYGNLRIVPDSFMFQEGQAKLYNRAKYGVFKFDQKGNSLLVGLADDKRQGLEQVD